MKKGVIDISTELLRHKLDLKAGVEIIGITHDPFRGIVTLLLHSDEMEDVTEGSYPKRVTTEDICNPFSYHLQASKQEVE